MFYCIQPSNSTRPPKSALLNFCATVVDHSVVQCSSGFGGSGWKERRWSLFGKRFNLFLKIATFAIHALACIGMATAAPKNLYAAINAAHPVSLSSAIVELSPDQVRVELQIMLEDLTMYHSIAADGNMDYDPQLLNEAAEKHRKFLADYFNILDVDGNKIVGKLESDIFDQIGDKPVPKAELMKRSVSYLYSYRLEKQRPQFLTFLQTFGGAKSALPSMMDLYITRNEIFEESAQIAFNRPHTIKIDWQRNPEGKKQSLAEIRKLRKDQLRDRLGIGSYSGLYSFLYINRFEVRHEILIPVTILEQFVPIPRAADEFLEVDEQTAVRPAIEKFFQTHGKITIDGTVVEPQIQRVNFFSLDISDFALNADPRRIGVHQGRVGVIVSYPSRKVPKSVSVEWDTFSEFAPFIQMVLLIGNQAPDQTYFYPNQSTYEWTGELLGPAVQSVPVAGKITEEKVRLDVAANLLRNIYRSFDFREDEDVYDSLATSVQGDLLRDTYLRVKKSLIMAEQGGDLSHMTELEVSECKPTGKQAETYSITWIVTGVSEHWGHIHTRATQYRGEVKLTEQNGNWKLAKLQLLDEQRIRFETSIRGNDTNKKP